MDIASQQRKLCCWVLVTISMFQGLPLSTSTNETDLLTMKTFQCKFFEGSESLVCHGELDYPDSSSDLTWKICYVGRSDRFCKSQSCQNNLGTQVYCTCGWLHCKFWANTTYRFILEMATNKKYEEHIHSDHIYQVLKPSNVEVKVLSSTSLQVEWKLDSSSMCSFERSPCNYKIVYSSKTEKANVTQNTDETSIELTRLHPHFTYNIRVYARKHKSHTWSEPYHVTVHMPEDVPREGPEIITFRATQCKPHNDTCRRVLIFWKAIPDDVKNGIIIMYNISIEGLTSKEKKHYLMHGDTHQYADLTGLSTEEAYRIAITAQTSVGSSPPQYMLLLNSSSIPSPLDDVIVEEDDIMTNFYWTPPHANVSMYTLYWCSEEDIKNFITCNGHLHSISIPGNVTSYTLYKQADDMSRWVYAISIDGVDGDNVSSGMQPHWLCTYNLSASPAHPEITFPEEQGERRLEIILTQPSCPIKPTDIISSATGFPWKIDLLLYKCLSKVNREEVCKDFGKNETLDYRTKTITIRDLTPDTRYQVTVKAVSHDKSSETVHYLNTTISAPDDPPVNFTMAKFSNKTAYFSWEPPTYPNGEILQYIIDIHGAEIRLEVNGDVHITDVSGLLGYTSYNASVYAKNKAGFSPLSWCTFSTPTWEPDQVNIGQVLPDGDNKIKITWQPPNRSNGPLSFYTVYLTWGSQTHYHYVPGDELNTIVTIPCEQNKKFPVNVTMLAVNTNEKYQNYTGPPSPTRTVVMCSDLGVSLPVWAISVLAILLLTIVGTVGICITKYIHGMFTKEIEIGEIPGDPPEVHDLVWKKDPYYTSSADLLSINLNNIVEDPVFEDSLKHKRRASVLERSGAIYGNNFASGIGSSKNLHNGENKLEPKMTISSHSDIIEPYPVITNTKFGMKINTNAPKINMPDLSGELLIQDIDSAVQIKIHPDHLGDSLSFVDNTVGSSVSTWDSSADLHSPLAQELPIDGLHEENSCGCDDSVQIEINPTVFLSSNCADNDSICLSTNGDIDNEGPHQHDPGGLSSSGGYAEDPQPPTDQAWTNNSLCTRRNASCNCFDTEMNPDDNGSLNAALNQCSSNSSSTDTESDSDGYAGNHETEEEGQETDKDLVNSSDVSPSIKTGRFQRLLSNDSGVSEWPSSPCLSPLCGTSPTKEFRLVLFGPDSLPNLNRDECDTMEC